MDQQTKDLISNEIANNEICLFMKGTPDAPQCGFSMAIANMFKILEVDFKGINVLENQSLREGIKEFSEWPTIPQIYIKGEFVGGCDIVKEMYESGELKKILESQKWIDKVISYDDEIPDCDYYTYLLSIPKVLEWNPKMDTQTHPYLEIDKKSLSEILPDKRNIGYLLNIDMNIKIRNTFTEIISVAIAIIWMYSKLNAAANMSIASITQVLVQGIGISILAAIFSALAIHIVSAIITKSKEKNVVDERDNIIEFYALRLSNVIFGISLLIILALLGWFNLPINFGIIAITLSVFLASICSTFLKIYLYK